MLVHQRHRLGILTITSRSRQADFGYPRETLRASRAGAARP
ncbi:MAG TPA: hypothetical protein VK586_26750 [Streptosporangiaceae bacterium]|nr:hypothetical protein [Streptosporangiaceae bacterium]